MGTLTRLSDAGEQAVRSGIHQLIRAVVGIPIPALEQAATGGNGRRWVEHYYQRNERQNPDGSRTYEQWARMRNDQGDQWEQPLGEVTLR